MLSTDTIQMCLGICWWQLPNKVLLQSSCQAALQSLQQTSCHLAFKVAWKRALSLHSYTNSHASKWPTGTSSAPAALSSAHSFSALLFRGDFPKGAEMALICGTPELQREQSDLTAPGQRRGMAGQVPPYQRDGSPPQQYTPHQHRA